MRVNSLLWQPLLLAVLVVSGSSQMARATLQDKLKIRSFSNANFADALNENQLARLEATAIKQRSWLDIKEGEILSPILVPRQIGSPGYVATQNLIVTTLSELGYAISWDNFTTPTPMGETKMANIIATKNPSAAKRLVLAAHYESKILPDGEFIGATDSAVPVAMILDIAKGLADLIDQNASSDISLQLVFFDGEEAFEEWTPSDSIYGSRHLAEFWEHNPDPATVAALAGTTEHRPELERVELMVLMDLIGASNNMFGAYQIPTADLFMQLSKLEDRLLSAKYISRKYMNTAIRPGSIGLDDDHRPFVQRDVPVMHLISFPFPKEWHKMGDNAESLNATVIADMSLIMRSFVASYLRLHV
ncbi:hypothetical protein LPJ78_001566 [Coemansia sp. RSA 989]|nr:hypothetical protein LPJ68_001384 [Coemansia sp. RSA 1086]KAJ1752270.1 hypothetical protein LPJ79_001348 [Coemansia sp. RSA 1821]KAJ1866726.1 hypothetical protein LPJ78_001566 [Coemansia sp. RSA 989]KAJ1873586.1 hypothetical protein LPJ55_002154 [Coemansia sp. RSA 990]KAJ2631755.1 hypothetical protein H4R22_001753 [Coemansia sp. RSA 1290]KAJ2648759.1 hypothetical protein IWW40_003702 [Coemansia sp. RSA 1250]KAJ2671046.1 hypothetical protein IWW42_003598 [Coemansia sp. RSA 1085]